MTFNISRRHMLVAGTGTALVAGMPAILRGAEPEPLANSVHGRLRGLIEKGVCVFRGVPYGGQLSGAENRFKAPPPPPSWTGERDATQYGAQAIQPVGGPAGGEPDPSEDCLFLNVWTPAPDGERRPVMFYCHGGGFTVGSGNRGYQNGANLAREQNVVVVQSNHRLGLFGYLYLADLLGPEYAGNQGLMDIVAALRWVNENIAFFGGDPHNVTVFGESGGGGKVTCLYGMPSADPFFAKASIESPIGPFEFAPDAATNVAERTMHAFGLTDPRGLLTLPAAQLLEFQTGGADASAPGQQSGDDEERPRENRDQMFWPVTDGLILPNVPFTDAAPTLSAPKPLIIGGCKDEAVFFHMGNPSMFSLDMDGVRSRLQPMLGDRTQAWIDTFSRTRPDDSPSQLFMAITTAQPWRARAVHIAEKKAEQNVAPVYSYILDYDGGATFPGTNFPVGTPHAADIPTKFNNVDPDAPPGNGPFGDNSPARKRSAINMSSMWGAFAHTGVPSAPGQPEWLPYTLEDRQTMIIDDECRMVSDPEGEERTFWQAEAAAAEDQASS